MNTYKSFSDSELTAQLRNASEGAFTELYDRYWAVLYVHAIRMTNDEDQAMDIVQDVFTVLWKKREVISVHSSVKSYLYKAVRNKVLNSINRGKLKDKYLKSLVSFIVKGEMHTQEQVEFRDFERRIDREVNNFPPRMKLIYEMSRKEGMSNKDIASDLEITDHTVKKTINRALHRLRTQISSFLIF